MVHVVIIPTSSDVSAVAMTEARARKKQVLFIHGGGEGGFEADAPLAASLRERLGGAYEVHFPRMPEDAAKADFGWGRKIGTEIDAIRGEVLLVGHSLGASMLLKYLSENDVRAGIGGIFLLATPFWAGDEDWQKGLALREDFANTLPKDVPIFLYHSLDDEEIDVSHLAIYAQKLPQAVIRTPQTGGHQFANDLSLIAEDIQSVAGRE